MIKYLCCFTPLHIFAALKKTPPKGAVMSERGVCALKMRNGVTLIGVVVVVTKKLENKRKIETNSVYRFNCILTTK